MTPQPGYFEYRSRSFTSSPCRSPAEAAEEANKQLNDWLERVSRTAREEHTEVKVVGISSWGAPFRNSFTCTLHLVIQLEVT